MLFLTWVKLKVYQISHKLVRQGLRFGVPDKTFEAKKYKPKLHIRTLVMWQTAKFNQVCRNFIA